MSEWIEIKGRTIAKGRAEGEALVSDSMLSFWGEVDPVTGNVIALAIHWKDSACVAACWSSAPPRGPPPLPWC
jgi:predicted aconitase with swiveling domain